MNKEVEMFCKLFEELKLSDTDVLLSEALTKAEIERMKDELATPEILPCAFDVSIDGWLWRIEKWGDVRIRHKDPETFRGKQKISRRVFLSRIGDESLNKMFGQWTIQKKGLTKVVFYRDYIGMAGKHFREQFIVDVKLRKELR